MGFINLLCMFVIVNVAFCETYNTKYDQIDVDSILASKRVLTNYIKCILDEGPCTPDGREFRKHIPEAITTNCAKCSDSQKRIIRKTSRFIERERPQDWNRISRKFDPQQKFTASFRKFLNEN
ncbi:ejaculatory bulb-specific protein 3 [Leptinotarsa decemlineata]|uniref:ejaculatory bulb-specific protein 3 n=1 Tax=Leptinotarsa decemlineata TaxID=7539 RepID=UPI000C2534C1|nr:ejaculatory bulb-specific protein 3-like [Leptinotarsa decemlineata]